MATCHGRGGGPGLPWAILRLLRAGGKALPPCPASALRRALGLPTCGSWSRPRRAGAGSACLAPRLFFAKLETFL